MGYGRGKQDGEFKAGDGKGKKKGGEDGDGKMWADGALQIEEGRESVQGEEKGKQRMEERVVGSANGDGDDDSRDKEQSTEGKVKGQGKDGFIGLD